MSDIDGDDAQQDFEDRMLDRDKAVSEEHDMTTEALRRGSGLDERLHEERGAHDNADELDAVPTELDEADEEADMVADPSLLGSEDGPFIPAEEAAVHVVKDAPGATDHPDDMTD